MLDDTQRQQLDKLWNELISSAATRSLPSMRRAAAGVATQDADPKCSSRSGSHQRSAAAFRKLLLDCEPKQVDALVDFAGRAYRRPLADEEAQGLRTLTPTSAKKASRMKKRFG